MTESDGEEANQIFLSSATSQLIGQWIIVDSEFRNFLKDPQEYIETKGNKDETFKVSQLDERESLIAAAKNVSENFPDDPKLKQINELAKDLLDNLWQKRNPGQEGTDYSRKVIQDQLKELGFEDM